MRHTAIMLAAVLLVGCVQTRYVQTPLPMPPRPDVPTIPDSSALMCLSDDAYTRLVNRDKAKTEHIERLEAIIETTHAE